ncbi:MAG TPA: hypothetical protein VJB90_00420 [Candidatus Nanoarchaeia archaeon]|nr:hypothetical protein [Candidatus Nanoarchaeia archaeon]
MNQGKDTLEKIMEGIARDAELETFVFFGGTAVDLLSGFADESSIGDLDISIKGIDTTTMDRYDLTIQKNGYTITKARRLYIISRTMPVFTTFARKGKTVIDANFMDDPTRVGLFNIDALYVLFPGYTIIDLHGTLEGLRSKTIVPVRDLSSENPYFLASRFIYVSAKYDISMTDAKNVRVAEVIVGHMVSEPTDPRGEFDSFLSSVFRSILRARDKVSYLKELIEIGILSPRLSDLESSVKQVIAGRHHPDMEKITTVNELVNFFAGYVPAPSRKDFYNKIKPLYNRTWENDDRRVTRIRST